MTTYRSKRVVDLVLSIVVVIVFAPILLMALLLVWLQDYKTPLYFAKRVGLHGRDFHMVKIRSMTVDADKTGINSTGAHDKRITPVGAFIRKYKIDEVAQFINVLFGQMSIVGPRPNTRSWGVDLYTHEELGLLSVKPGITDFSSIVFSDEGDILNGSTSPDVQYNQLIRPWKSRLGLLYIQNTSLFLDCRIIWLTLLNSFNRRAALRGIESILIQLDAPQDVVSTCRRDSDLLPSIPPGASDIFRVPE